MSDLAGPLYRLHVVEPEAYVEEQAPEVIHKPSPNWGVREYGPIDTIVIHCTAGRTTEGAVATLLDPKSAASAHIVIPRAGRKGEPERTIRMVEDTSKAWHVRREVVFMNRNDVNSRSLGIEIVNTCLKDDKYSAWQVEEAARWCRHWINRFPIRYIVTHARLDPKRRLDPGDHFPWDHFIKLVEQDMVIDRQPIKFLVDGEEVDVDGGFFDGKVYAEARGLLEKLGARVEWEGRTRTVKITRP